jgi:trimethylamine--corrinoid protein Co-methyltransferase
MFEALVGDLASKPFVIPYFNPVTPLVMNSGTLDKMQDAIMRGLPVIFPITAWQGCPRQLPPLGHWS